MENLTEKNNVSGGQSGSLLEPQKLREHLEKLKDWQLSPDEKRISRSFNFKTFSEAIDYVNHLADFAEKIKHYPYVIIIRFPEVTIELATREIDGLSEKDFIVAQEADDIAGWKIRFERWMASPKIIIFLLIILVLVTLWLYR